MKNSKSTGVDQPIGKGETPQAIPSPTALASDGELYALAVTYCDVENNRFLCLGAANFRTEQERAAILKRIPAATAESDFILDVEDRQGVVDDRFISPATVEVLIGEPVSVLIKRAGEAAEAEDAQARKARR